MQAEVDLVLMDIQMPVMDGIQATSHIRALNTPKRDIPIVALTADAVHGAEERYRSAGMDAYLSKPISARTLFETLNALATEPRQRSAVPDTAAAVDHTVIDALRDFLTPDQLEALLTETLADIGARIGRLGACLDTTDTQGAAQQAHDLVSVSGNCGAQALSAVARDIERACRLGLLAHATQDFARIPELAADAAIALAAVRDALATP
jgi:CheY-like chemotaxis protein